MNIALSIMCRFTQDPILSFMCGCFNIVLFNSSDISSHPKKNYDIFKIIKTITLEIRFEWTKINGENEASC